MLLILLFLVGLVNSIIIKSVHHISPTIRSYHPTHTLTNTAETSVPTKPIISLKINSKHSYIQDFFNSISPFKIASTEIKTTIKNYEDSVADENNLHKFLDLLKIENEKDDFDDIHSSYKQFSKPKSQPKKDERKLNLEEFKKYLKNEKNFLDEDLKFLDNNLNYGFDEIDEELRKIDDKKKNNSPKNIKIGGEVDNGANKSNLNVCLLVLMILVQHIT